MLTGGLSRMEYARARLLLVVGGLGILAVLVAVLLIRSVDEIEVIATLLFVPIFLLLMFLGLPGGIAGAVLATVVYVLLRRDAIDAVGWGEFAGLVIGRSLSYFLFGIVGGWASKTLELSLDKLDLYDQIDDTTGIYNARFLLQDVELERARCERYQTVFSVVFVEFPADALSSLRPRRRRTLLRELGYKVQEGVRTVDRVAHGSDGRVHRIAAVLPETATDGAAVFRSRFVVSLEEFFAANDVPGTVVTGQTCTIPGGDDALAAQLEHWAAIDATEHATPAVVGA